MTLQFSDGAYNLASGTRDAFGALSDDMVAEGYPPMTSRSGDREPADQLRIWYERMTLTPGNRKVYGTKRWQGRTWYQIHPDSVGIPDTSNHEKRRANDLRAPYNSDTAAHRRAQVLAKRHNITCEGMGFREWWHWTFWGPLGTIGAPASAGGETTAPPVSEEDDMPRPDKKLVIWNDQHYFLIGDETIHHIVDTAWLPYLREHYGPRGEAQAIDNGALTLETVVNAIPWAAVDACMRGDAYGPDKRSWSRLQAEGIAIRGTQAAQTKTLADVLATAKSIESS